MERELTYSKAIREAMAQKMREDAKVFLMGEEHIKDMPVSEAAIAGAEAGAEVTGMRPIAEIVFSDFLTIAADQMVNQAAKMRYMFGGKAKVPMVVRAAAGSGSGAAAQHSQSLEAWFCHIPGLRVIAPSTPYDAKGLLISAIEDDNPVIFFEQRKLYQMKGMVPEELYRIPIGKADIKRMGKDVTVITYGRMVQMCLKTADKLAGEGIDVEIVDLRTLSPLDKETIIGSVRKTGRVVIVHEANLTGGIGGEVSAVICDSIAFYYLDAPVKRVCGLDVPIPYNRELERNAVPTVEKIEAAIKDII
ncbi:MAG: alpha-ketoacid dehydrogenase subunit beta [Dorea sp.]|nr:alpha-ketoacid dehydrogenase subunit beta [Dorea sp.]